MRDALVKSRRRSFVRLLCLVNCCADLIFGIWLVFKEQQLHSKTQQIIHERQGQPWMTLCKRLAYCTFVCVCVCLSYMPFLVATLFRVVKLSRNLSEFGKKIITTFSPWLFTVLRWCNHVSALCIFCFCLWRIFILTFSISTCFREKARHIIGINTNILHEQGWKKW